MHGDIDDAGLDCDLAELLDEAASRRAISTAAGGDADQRNAGEVRIALDDFVRDASERTFDRRGIEDESGRDRRGEGLVAGFMSFLGDLAGSL